MAIRETDTFPPQALLYPEPFFLGKDCWLDLAVDSQSPAVVLWLRKSAKGKFRVVSSCVGGHVMKKDLTEDEARYVYRSMGTKAKDFDIKVVVPERKKQKTTEA